MPEFSWTTAVLFLLDWSLRLGFALHILLRRRTLAVTLIWIAIVLVVPVAGVVFYLLFGQVRVGEDRLVWSRRLTADLFNRATERFRRRGQTAEPADEPDQTLSNLTGSTTGLPALTGNRLELIDDTDAFLDGLIADIDAADRSAFIQTYIWQTRGRAEEVAEALARASARGVDCRVLVDAMGSYRWLRSRSCQRLREAGVCVVSELPVGIFRVLIRRLDIRNHRKIAVFDARVAYVGSHNLTDRTFGTTGRDPAGPWIDASVRVDGPAAQALQLVVVRDWSFDAQERVEDLDALMPMVEAHPDGAVTRCLPSGPGLDAQVLQHSVLAVLYNARREVLLVTPYFVPDDATLGAMTAASRRGVRVALVLPARNDSSLVAAAARSTYPGLLRAGVEVYEYRPSLLHTKAIVQDGQIATLGSGNLDIRSFQLNFEIMLAVHDEAFAIRVRALIQRYIAESDRVPSEPWTDLPIHRALPYNLANLASQIL